MDDNKPEQKELPPKTEAFNKPEDVFAYKFQTYSPIYDAAVDKLSLREARRALKALVKYPFSEQMYHRKGPETAVLQMGEELIQAKQMMILHFVSSQMEQENNSQQQTKENENG